MKLVVVYILTVVSWSFSQAQQLDIKNKKEGMAMQNLISKHGIEGQTAPKWTISSWVDGKGEKIAPVLLTDYIGKFKVVYCFQAWCPGCHSKGLPDLKKMVASLKDNDHIAFLAIQTVFEGAHANTYNRMLEIQKQYDLNIPFGHDVGDENSGNVSNIMYHYRTGGTPWFILIDEEDRVVFNDFHLDVDKAIEYLQQLGSK